MSEGNQSDELSVTEHKGKQQLNKNEEYLKDYFRMFLVRVTGRIL